MAKSCHAGRTPGRDPPAARCTQGVALTRSSTTSSPEKQPPNQPFQSFTWLCGPNLSLSNENKHAETCKGVAYLVMSKGWLSPESRWRDSLTRSTGTVHLGEGFCSVAGVSCCRQNKNAGNPPSSQSYLFLRISFHLGLRRWVFYTVYPALISSGVLTREGFCSLILPQIWLIFHLPLKSNSSILCNTLALSQVKNRYSHLNSKNIKSIFPGLNGNICEKKQPNTAKCWNCPGSEILKLHPTKKPFPFSPVS